MVIQLVRIGRGRVQRSFLAGSVLGMQTDEGISMQLLAEHHYQPLKSESGVSAEKSKNVIIESENSSNQVVLSTVEIFRNRLLNLPK